MLSATSASNASLLVKVNLDGGTLTFDLPEDGDDVLTLSADSLISLNGGTLVVDMEIWTSVLLANAGNFLELTA